MKTVFRFLASILMLTAFVALSATVNFAQDPCADTDAITAADAKVRENFPKIETRKIAIDAGKEYIGKYSTCEVSKAFVEWLKPLIPAWEKQVRDNDDLVWRKPRVEKFDSGVKNAKFDDVYAAGAELL